MCNWFLTLEKGRESVIRRSVSQPTGCDTRATVSYPVTYGLDEEIYFRQSSSRGPPGKIAAMIRYGVIVWSLGSAFLTSGATAQTVDASNYRRYAQCAETQVAGRWFNTFGEGRCPVGSRRASTSGTSNQSDINAQTMRQTQASVAALGAAQQSLLSLGRAIGRSYQAASDKRVSTYAYHLPADPVTVAPSDMYKSRKVTFPLSGTVVVARLGEPVLSESDGFLSDCFISLQGGEAKQIGGHRHTVQPGELACRIKEKDSGFTPLYNNYSFSRGAMTMMQSLKLNGASYQLCYRNMGMNAMCVKDISQERVVKLVGIVELKSTNRDLVAFQGSQGGKISFIEGQNTLSFDMKVSRSIKLGDVDFEVLEHENGQLVMRRR